MPRRYGPTTALFNTDCEGPTVAHDNAAEIAEHKLPHGRRLFEQLSRFDDYTAYVRKKPNYNPGDTLRLIIPFLKAYDMTEDEFTLWVSSIKIKWITDARKTVRYLTEMDIPVFEISASYRPFAARIADELGLHRSHIYCTPFALDKYEMGGSEKLRLAQIVENIVQLPSLPDIILDDQGAFSGELSESQRSVCQQLEEMVWGEMAEELPCAARMLLEIRAMGGKEKVGAIYDTLVRTNIPPDRTIYVGDSITDVEAFRELERVGGVAISFNGNEYAVASASYVCWGRSSLVPVLLGRVFERHKRQGLDRFAASGGQDRSYIEGDAILEKLYDELPSGEWGFALRSAENVTELVEVSNRFRVQTRDDAAGLS